MAEQWHPVLNGDLTPAQVATFSAKIVWCACAEGHEWQAHVYDRARNSGCAVCSRRVTSALDNFATLEPDLAAQWHPSLNGDLRPEAFRPHSHQMIWWRCDDGHEWQARIAARTSGHGCSSCIDRQYRSKDPIFITHPPIAAQWDPEKNAPLTPHAVTHGSSKRVWWLCGAGHEWPSMISTRCNGRDESNTAACPYCSRRLASPEYNLQAIRPMLAAEWDLDLNAPLTPSNVLPSSGRSVWWLCAAAGHSWRARIASRLHGSGCLICDGRQLPTRRPSD